MAIVRDLSGNGPFGVDTHIATRKVTLEDAIPIPSAVAGLAQIFVDDADGDLKVIFADGVTKTLATDT